MLFQSATYGLFLALAFAICWLIREQRTPRVLFLLGASWFFYALWNETYLLLIIGSTVLDFIVAKRIVATPKEDHRRRIWWLRVSIIGNLTTLGIFKYYDFFCDNIAILLEGTGLAIPRLDVLLPVGISFYTFQSLSYTIDVYRGKMEPARNLREFALFVAFFPQLVAGPIVRAREFLPQLERSPFFTERTYRYGLYRIAIGIFKKVLIADVLAQGLVDQVFLSTSDHTGFAALLGIYAYTIQVYCDFSGYSDIAIGSARILGFRLPKNFDSPYLATSIRDFWRRWHITLGSWLRDYLYIPLGGSRGTVSRTCFNLILTMLLGGIWHGAGWSFVIWGLYHGVWLAISHVWHVKKLYRPRSRLGVFWSILITYHLVAISWCFIRADVDVAFLVLGRVAEPWSSVSLPWYVWLAFAGGFLTHLLPRVAKSWITIMWQKTPALFIGAFWALFVGLLAAVMSDALPFVYFQF